MRKTLTKGAYVKVINPDLLYKESPEIATELGSTEKFHIKMPRTGTVGDVMGSKDGYVLVDAGDYEFLIDQEGIEPAIRPSEITIIARYMRSGTIEEFVSEKELKDRISKLISDGHLKIEDEIKVYEIEKSRTLKIKLDVFLD